MIEAKGISFPFRFHGGRVVVSTDETHIKESVFQIIAIGKNEYLMLPDFGSDIYKRVFTPTNMVAMVTGDIRNSLTRFEPRINSVNVIADMETQDTGEVPINVSFQIKGEIEQSLVSFSIRS